jgi:hypothetical protein
MIMTQDKARKAAVRRRMAETGEPYSVARHAVEHEHEGAAAGDPFGAERGAPPADDRWYAGAAEEAGITVAEFRVQHLADLADNARERAEVAEEAVSVAREAAELAQQAADMTQGWADKQEQERAQRRANQARAAAEEAQRRADQAQRQADAAEEAADDAADLADETADNPHIRPHGSYRDRDRDHDGADPGRSYQPLGPADRLEDLVGKVLRRFDLLMSRAGQTTNPAHDEPKETDSD